MYPIILGKKVKRDNNFSKPFYYDYRLDMNIENSGTHLFIESEDSDYKELFTKTECTRERDDDEYSFLELISKTFADRERDDEDDSYYN